MICRAGFCTKAEKSGMIKARPKLGAGVVKRNL